MSPHIRTLSSSVATKILIGVTGLALFLYLIIHIAGNLMVFLGPSAFNRYAFALEGNPLIPLIEIGLVLIFGIHIVKTVRNFLANREARPVPYVRKQYAGKPSRKTVASSTMIISGLWLLAFIVVHVKAFRYGTEYPWPAGGRDLYRLEMENFSSPSVLVFYVLSMIIVGSHLWHGVAGGFQSLGVDHPKWTPRLLVVGKVVAVAIAGAFIAIAIWAHVVGARS